MLDIKLIREDVEGVIRRLQTRGGDYSYLRTVYQLDEERRKEFNQSRSTEKRKKRKKPPNRYPEAGKAGYQRPYAKRWNHR